MSYTVRLARAADSPAVVEVIRSVFDEYGFTWDPEDYHADLYDLDAHYLARGLPFWLAEQDGLPVGTVAVDLFDPLPGSPYRLVELEGASRIAGTDCSLERLYVRPEGRRRGLGRALVDLAIDWVRGQDRRAMEIWSDKRFGDAHRLYERLGAVVVGDRICDDPDVSPEWGLVLELR